MKDDGKCSLCGMQYGDDSDPKLQEEWLQCVGCKSWLHETCAEQFGIIDDNSKLTCFKCLEYEHALT